MIVLVATFQAKPGKEKVLEEKLKGMIPNVQGEDGTTMYILNRSASDASEFLFYEMYKDKTSLDFHSSTPYFQDFINTVDELIIRKPQLNFYEDIASIKR